MRAMASNFVVVCGLVFLQGAWCAPADSTTSTSATANSLSYGSQFANDLNKNMAAASGNIHNGVSSIGNSLSHFWLDSVPNLFSEGVHTALEKIGKQTDTNREAFGKVANGVGHAIGGGAQLLSSAAGGAMQVVGHTLGAGGNVIEAGAKAGLGLAGKIADNTEGMTKLAGTISSAGLTAAGDGMATAAVGGSVITNGVSNMMDALGERTAQGISTAKKMLSDFMDKGASNVDSGLMKIVSEAFELWYNNLKHMLQVMESVQQMLDNVTTSISSAGTSSGATSAGTLPSGTSVATGALPSVSAKVTTAKQIKI